jgi:putative flippase GtrA
MIREFIRFAIVGCINTGTYYVLYLLFNEVFGWNYLPSHITAFILSMIGSFYLNSYYTYKTKPTLKKFLQFPLTYVVNITVSTLFLYVFVHIFKMSELIAPIISVFFTIPFTFMLSGKILKSDS